MGFIKSMLRNAVADCAAVLAFGIVLAFLWWGPK
jgi:hypothetical protein